MTANSSENCGGSSSPNASIQNSGFFILTITSLSYDQNSIGSMEKKNCSVRESSNSQTASVSVEVHRSSGSSSDTPTSKNESGARDKESDFQSKEELGAKAHNLGSVELELIFTASLGNINTDADQS